MGRKPPGMMWVALVTLALITVATLVTALTQVKLGLLVAAILNTVLLVGLYTGRRWAFVLTLFFCAVGALFALVQDASTALWALCGNSVVAFPVLLSKGYFFGTTDVASGADPLVCPGCGYSLLGLTTPRCPECGRTFNLPT